ncbi:IclR family transcriptional regulator [Ornithinimicrobium humiphilum]|uniref:IclR family transcriptional regulator n=2 Tax=Ornithinimicrobium humiphilum TaxID=125288 RepID=A0A543K7L4_9MICO|nr:IclR family transcriptional regulator [Ornithinimicrobium humiphilum]
MNDFTPPALQSLQRATDVLFALEGGVEAQTPAQLAARLGLNRTTVWRYLVTLAASGLAREVPGGRFALGPRTLGLAGAYAAQWGRFGTAGGVVLERLRDATGETAGLHLREGWARVPIRQAESHHELRRTYGDLGASVPLHVGSPSLVILAHLEPQEQDAFLDSRTEFAPPERERLSGVLAEIRAQGYASSQGARVGNTWSIAAPVRDPTGQVVGAINITGPEQRFTASTVPGFIDEVVGASRWLEGQLGAGAASQARPQ